MPMPPVVTPRDTQRCPRCAGPMFRDYDIARLAFLCLLCGEYAFPSPPPRLVGRDRQAAAPAGSRRQVS
jgi:hypothetical protein